MTLVYTKEEVVKLFSRFGLSAVEFVTIPPTKTMPVMSNVVRRLRPYVDMMYIVRGAVGGHHYHALVHWKPDVTVPIFVKFHLNRKTLTGVNRVCLEDLQDIEKAKYFTEVKKERNFFTIIPENAQYVCGMLSGMITTYFIKQNQDIKRKTILTKKQFHIGSVYDYLLKNYNENVENEYYVTEQLINLFVKKKKRSIIHY